MEKQMSYYCGTKVRDDANEPTEYITKESVLHDALLAFSKTTVGRERAIAERLAVQAKELAEAAD
jgi:hypothetical protein